MFNYSYSYSYSYSTDRHSEASLHIFSALDLCCKFIALSSTTIIDIIMLYSCTNKCVSAQSNPLQHQRTSMINFFAFSCMSNA